MADDERLSPQSANELEIADEASNETKDNENKEENQKEKEEKTGGKDKEGAAATREKSPNEVSKGNPHNQPNGESIYKTDTSSTDSQSIRSRVFVGHLNTERASRRDLDKLFSECGKVVAISLLGGYGFIQYDNEESARKAIEDIHGTPFFGMKLVVDKPAAWKRLDGETLGEPRPWPSDPKKPYVPDTPSRYRRDRRRERGRRDDRYDNHYDDVSPPRYRDHRYERYLEMRYMEDRLAEKYREDYYDRSSYSDHRYRDLYYRAPDYRMDRGRHGDPYESSYSSRYDRPRDDYDRRRSDYYYYH